MIVPASLTRSSSVAAKPDVRAVCAEIASVFIFAPVTAVSAILAVVTAAAFILAAVTADALILAVVTALSASKEVVIPPVSTA